MADIPTYLVSTGIVGDGVPSYATYVRKGRSLRRVRSIDLPVLPTREEALAYLAFWLHCKACTGPMKDRPEYRRQLERVKGEIVALGGMPDPGDTGVPYGGRSGEAARIDDLGGEVGALRTLPRRGAYGIRPRRRAPASAQMSQLRQNTTGGGEDDQ